MILLIDADSLIFASCYRSKNDVNYEIYPDNFYTNIKDSINKFDEQYMKIINEHYIEDINCIAISIA